LRLTDQPLRTRLYLPTEQNQSVSFRKLQLTILTTASIQLRLDELSKIYAAALRRRKTETTAFWSEGQSREQE